MWTRTVGTLLLTLIPLVALAADPEQAYRGDGFLYYGPGRAPGGGLLQQLGGGAEGFLYKGLAVGADIAYQFPSAGFSYGIGLLSIDGSYHLNRNPHAKLSPFLSGGYTLAFHSGYANLANFGAGVTWWMAKHAGLRVEIRDYIWPGGNHSPQALLGFSFR